ncbi:hypothetical protein, partial [Treponema sp. R80B11-R83G3]
MEEEFTTNHTNSYTMYAQAFIKYSQGRAAGGKNNTQQDVCRINSLSTVRAGLRVAKTSSGIP